MSDLEPLSQQQVEDEISRLSGQLTTNTVDNREAAMQAAKADVAYKLAMARGWIRERGHKGTVAEKEADILLSCEREFEDHKLTEAVYKATQEKGRNLRAQLDALRTVNANIRASIDYSHGRGG